MTMITPERLIRSLSKTPVVMDALLQGVTQERALAAADEGGWNVLYVICHLRDFGAINFERARQIVEQDHPTLRVYDQEALVTEHDYAHQQLDEVFRSFLQTRRAFLDWLRARAESDWGRRAFHPEAGEVGILDLLLSVTAHELDHLAHIARLLCLPSADTDGIG